MIGLVFSTGGDEEEELDELLNCKSQETQDSISPDEPKITSQLPVDEPKMTTKLPVDDLNVAPKSPILANEIETLKI